MPISYIQQGDMTLSDNDVGSNNTVTWDIGISEILQGTGEILSNRNMQHWYFLKLTCDIRTPRQGPQSCNDWRVPLEDPY